MGRWTQYDEDSYRLPEGVVRTGYDADTQEYFYTNTSTNRAYVGAPRARYGPMYPVCSSPSPDPSLEDSDDNSHTIEDSPPAGPSEEHSPIPQYVSTLPSLPSNPRIEDWSTPPAPRKESLPDWFLAAAEPPRSNVVTRRATLPAMSTAVHKIKRSMTLNRKNGPVSEDDKPTVVGKIRRSLTLRRKNGPVVEDAERVAVDKAQRVEEEKRTVMGKIRHSLTLRRKNGPVVEDAERVAVDKAQ